MANENTQLIRVKTTGAAKSKKQIQGVSNGLKSMAKSAALAAGAYFGSRALLGAIQSSIDLYKEQELAEVKLRQALGKSIVGLQDYASSLQQVTNFGDELILQGMAQLAFFIKDEEQLKVATKATLDLASAKGMDLVQAADLVAKSVGSSTNALSRYGIAAEGAVGSEERLLSITNEIGNLFGGQAEATTQSLSGAMDQLSNAIGDTQEAIGEALAPVVNKLAKFFKRTAEEADHFIRSLTETPFETTIRQMKDLGMETAEYEKVLNSIAQRKLVGQMAEDYQQILEPVALINRSIKEQEALLAEEVEITARMSEVEEELGETRAKYASREMEELEKKLKDIEKEKEENENLINIAEQQIQRQGELNILKEEEKELNKSNFNILLDTGQATDDILDKEKAGAKTRAKILKDGEKAQDNLMNKLKSSAQAKRSEDIKDAMRSAASSAVKAYEWASEWGGPIAGAIAGAIAFTAAGALAAKVEEFATGGDFVTNGPQLIMVGDNPSQREHVQITPLGGDPNINGPQGGGITLNISNPIMAEDFVESDIIPKIREGLRLGENIGI